MSGGQESLLIEGISKTYPVLRKAGGKNRISALKNVSMTVRRGEILCIVGPSGCGKSTLLDIIAGLTLPTEGTVTLNGLDITGRPGTNRAVVLQGYALFPWLNARENVEFGLHARGIPKKERREAAMRYLRAVGLDGFERCYPHELSGGMKQRTAIARALACEPDILLMDEPFGAVDTQTREALQNELLSLWQRTEKTILLVTHSIEEAVYLGSRVAVMTSSPGEIRGLYAIPRTNRDCSLNSSPIHNEMTAELRRLLHTPSARAEAEA